MTFPGWAAWVGCCQKMLREGRAASQTWQRGEGRAAGFPAYLWNAVTWLTWENTAAADWYRCTGMSDVPRVSSDESQFGLKVQHVLKSQTTALISRHPQVFYSEKQTQKLISVCFFFHFWIKSRSQTTRSRASVNDRLLFLVSTDVRLRRKLTLAGLMYQRL